MNDLEVIGRACISTKPFVMDKHINQTAVEGDIRIVIFAMSFMTSKSLSLFLSIYMVFVRLILVNNVYYLLLISELCKYIKSNG